MTFINTRVQHAVGQGFFHTGHLKEDDQVKLRYIYDCGAMARYGKSRSACIDAHIMQVGPNSVVDVLFISHAHADHINGLTRLLDRGSGLRVRTIILPLLDVRDRLMAYARTATEDRASAADKFYQSFIVDPAAALSRFGPERIIFVERGNGGGAPGSDGEPPMPVGGDWWLDQTAETLPWKLVGRGRYRTVAPSADGGLSAKVNVIPDTMALMAVSGAPYLSWLLAPFVDPTAASDRKLFFNALGAEIGMSSRKLASWLKSTTNVQGLLTNRTAALRAAYAAVNKDLNVTSLCLYSGPSSNAAAGLQTRLIARFGSWEADQRSTPLAWLATGDAALASPVRRKAFLAHYGRLLSEVVTLTLPHHGSDHNFHADLVNHVPANFFIAAADRFSNWSHPGPGVQQSIASKGRFVSVVTSNRNSAVAEYVFVA